LGAQFIAIFLNLRSIRCQSFAQVKGIVDENLVTFVKKVVLGILLFQSLD